MNLAFETTIQNITEGDIVTFFINEETMSINEKALSSRNGQRFIVSNISDDGKEVNIVSATYNTTSSDGCGGISSNCTGSIFKISDNILMLAEGITFAPDRKLHIFSHQHGFLQKDTPFTVVLNNVRGKVELNGGTFLVHSVASENTLVMDNQNIEYSDDNKYFGSGNVTKVEPTTCYKIRRVSQRLANNPFFVHNVVVELMENDKGIMLSKGDEIVIHDAMQNSVVKNRVTIIYTFTTQVKTLQEFDYMKLHLSSSMVSYESENPPQIYDYESLCGNLKWELNTSRSNHEIVLNFTVIKNTLEPGKECLLSIIGFKTNNATEANTSFIQIASNADTIDDERILKVKEFYSDSIGTSIIENRLTTNETVLPVLFNRPLLLTYKFALSSSIDNGTRIVLKLPGFTVPTNGVVYVEEPTNCHGVQWNVFEWNATEEVLTIENFNNVSLSLYKICHIRISGMYSPESTVTPKNDLNRIVKIYKIDESGSQNFITKETPIQYSPPVGISFSENTKLSIRRPSIETPSRIIFAFAVNVKVISGDTINITLPGLRNIQTLK